MRDERLTGEQGELAIRLFTEWKDRLLSRAFRYTKGDAEAADELLSATFLTVCRKIAQLRSPESPGGWLFSILRTEALAPGRRRPTLSDRDYDEIEAEIDPALHAEEDREYLALRCQSIFSESLARYFDCGVRNDWDAEQMRTELGVTPEYERRLRQRFRVEFSYDFYSDVKAKARAALACGGGYLQIHMSDKLLAFLRAFPEAMEPEGAEEFDIWDRNPPPMARLAMSMRDGFTVNMIPHQK